MQGYQKKNVPRIKEIKYLAKEKKGKPKKEFDAKVKQTRLRKTPKMLVKTVLNKKCITIVYRRVEH